MVSRCAKPERWLRKMRSLASVVQLACLFNFGGLAIGATDIDKSPTPTEFYSRYRTTPVVLNDSWGNVASLWLRSNSFVRSQTIGDPIPIYKGVTSGYETYQEIFFGSYGDLFGDGSLVQVQGSWAVSTPNNLDGSLHVIQLTDTGISKINLTSIQGTTSPWIGDFAKMGKPQIFVPGFRDFTVVPAQSYLVSFDKASSNFTKTPIGSPTTSHTSFLGSWSNDGVPTVLATTYGSVGRAAWNLEDNQPVLYQADGVGGMKQSFLGKYSVTESSIAFADFNKDGIQDLVTADTDVQLGAPSFKNIADKGSYLLLGQSDGSYVMIRLPDAYFQSSEYDGIDNKFLPYGDNTAAQVRTHKIAIRVLDINGDGRPDIVISGGVWSDITPYRAVQFLIQQPDGTFRDETNQRLFNYDLRGSIAHQVFFEDINGDGFSDMILADTTAQVFPTSAEGTSAGCATQGNEVLINDGEGHFISVMKDAFCKFASSPSYVRSFNPWFNKSTRKLGFVEISHQQQADKVWRYLYTQAVASASLSTGPNFIDPIQRGEPGFNEWYYLLHYPDARAAVDTGSYANGLEYFLAVGKKRGDKTHVDGALNATSMPEDCLMNWAEQIYPGLFAPATTSKTVAPYYYRYYWATNAYLGMSAMDQHVYYLNRSGSLLDVGAQQGFLAAAGCRK